MVEIDLAYPEDIAYITDISEAVFSEDTATAPEGYDNCEWYYRAGDTGYLFKILFNGMPIGGFVAFRTGRFNFHLERLFILSDYRNLGIGKKAVQYAFLRFPEARVWYSDVRSEWENFTGFLLNCGFFESGYTLGKGKRFIKIL